MNEPYAEMLDGAMLPRPAPGQRHELVCARLHQIVHASVANFRSTRLLPPRSEVRLNSRTAFRPDLALITTATDKLWLAAEIISSGDHQADTVIKKQVYEDLRIPRLWMVDPRYDNIEVYHAGAYGLALKEILAGKEILKEKLLPEFQLVIEELFQAPTV